MESGFRRLFEPIRIGPLSLENRLVMAPMIARFGVDEDGAPDDEQIAYVVERAAGGVGLVMLGAASITSDTRFRAYQLGIHDDGLIPGLRRLATAVKEAGARIGIQLHHPGARAGDSSSGRVVAPSPIPCYPLGVVPTALGEAEIAAIVDAFGRAAARAREAGFDAIEIHGAHGYLLSEFLSPFSNKREDGYGGSLENRVRFPSEVLRQCREQGGPALAYFFKMNGTDFLEGGITVEDSRRQAQLLAEAGADCLVVSGGRREVYNRQVAPSTPELNHGWLVPFAAAVKEAVSVPVAAVGRLDNLRLAEKVLSNGEADLIAIGRGLLADPELPSKARGGKATRIRRCTGCNEGCLDLKSPPDYVGVSCLVNPRVGHERSFTVRPTSHPQRIMVVGGGVAGLEAARVLAERGHRVELYEQEGVVGGQLRAVARNRRELGTLISYLTRSLKESGVAIHLNQEVTPRMAEERNPEIVVLATGAEPGPTSVPGGDRSHVFQGIDVLMGRSDTGRRVVVVGGGLVGLEVAEFLVKRDKEVQVVAEGNPWAGIGASIHIARQQLFLEHGALIHRAKVVQIVEKGLYALADGELMLVEADSIVLATERRPRNHLGEQLKGLPLEVYTIGDCVTPKRALEAMHDAARLGYSL